MRSMKSPRLGRSLVEEQDLHMLYLLLEWRAESASRTAPEGPEQTAERLSTRATSLSIQELRDQIKQRLELQVCESISDLTTNAFRLDVKPSSIPNAGRGVFANGNATPGQVVALMPGLVYPRSHHRDIPGYPSFGDESMLLMCRHDGHVIDARAWDQFQTNTIREYNAARRRRDGQHGIDTLWFHPDLRKVLSPLALGHFINHPPEGVPPNVLPAPVDWSGNDVSKVPWSLYQVPGEGSSVAPNDLSVARGGTTPDKVVPGLAFVATRPIKHGEELLVNYRLNPGVIGGLPKWYAAVDEEEDQLRWL